ncbi:DUF4307 domain-containing protein [Rhodococcus sp. IEGM 1409]|uniref:DUF4307 domain-containing protein n=1 Tax=Rhodococcus sp. IEGM 1409 TaxID=3047082 RepID=UPI0024B71219|nr:DUF4307 domain-containing protein [Rhodococcus sp. IEGM 1409]MDI9898413.1 DUF4307 domain-containing protein [Rhodococcus sp. IEGM 1409]
MSKPLPQDRYPSTTRTGSPRKWMVWALTALVIVVGGGIAYYAYGKFAVKEIETETISFDIANDATVKIRFTVTRDDSSREAMCIVRARSKDGSETGRREVYVPPSEHQTLDFNTEVKTSQPPGMADVYGCSFDVPEYLTKS